MVNVYASLQALFYLVDVAVVIAGSPASVGQPMDVFCHNVYPNNEALSPLDEAGCFQSNAFSIALGGEEVIKISTVGL